MTFSDLSPHRWARSTTARALALFVDLTQRGTRLPFSVAAIALTALLGWNLRLLL